MSFIGTQTKTKIQDNHLQCPKCDGEYLHQVDVSFSSYGESLRLSFWCEDCHGRNGIKKHNLFIQQHKGHTYIEWEIDGANYD
jgi:hypothetical protein